MNDRTRVLVAVGVTVVLFLGVQFGALALIEPFHESDRQAVENPEDPTNSVVYFAIILAATGLMLAAFKFDLQWLIRALIVGVSVMLAWFVFTEFVPPVITAGPVNVIAVLASLGVGLALLLYPEWYVIDATGVLMGAGAAALFGISFGLLPALLLLAVLAVYDAISVYGTEHMLDLAEGVMDLKIPVVLVIPTSLSYSYLESTDPANLEESSEPDALDSETEAVPSSSGPGPEPGLAPDPDAAEETESEDARDFERDALFIGLGDAVIPTILVVSAAFFLEVEALEVPWIALNVPALGALLGTIAGLVVLMYMVIRGRAHAGLPLLNGGAIGGYLLGALASGVSIATALGF
ncbi:presenilin family intramembrane aspartyl protease PSH [Natronobacterium texcoconense]|uniref:Presenilin-like membrane protease, A22 family n=1 Tax=Natronobacterium texcoconense TaxID=1095778 RepID=A0A1H1IW72_NATTX|nr:presenilin family intramembrane aspartyl protease PSH [Natronobacterium texcoconense]SDR41538.1 Presenilin-like membrane protease, A22 family [Natronobacterium texcoconense]